MNKFSGFTLIELLVVIAIMALIGTYVLSNYGRFGEDQKLKNTALDIVSLLKTAQTNATSGSKCQNLSSLSWLVAFTNNTTLDLKCQNSSGTSGSIKSISPAVTTTTYSFAAGTCTPTQVSFAPLNGTMTSNCNSDVTITVTNSEGNSKQVFVERGGRIYAE